MSAHDVLFSHLKPNRHLLTQIRGSRSTIMGKYGSIHQISCPSSKCLWVQIFHCSHKVLHSSQMLPGTFLLVPFSYIPQLSPFSDLYLFECSLLLLLAMVICALSFIFLNLGARELWASSHTFSNRLWMGQNGSNNLCARALLLLLLFLVSLIPVDFSIVSSFIVCHLFFLLLLLLGFGCHCLWWGRRWCYNIGLMHGNIPIDDGRQWTSRTRIVASSHDNGNCLAKILLLTVWHNFDVFRWSLLILL